MTKPLVFDGRELELNFSTSAAGSIRVELQSSDGTPVEGHALADCPEVFGDAPDRLVTWTGDEPGPVGTEPEPVGGAASAGPR